MVSNFSEPLGIGDEPNRWWQSVDGTPSGFEVVSEDGKGKILSITSYAIADGISAFHFHRARGTKDAPEAIQANDNIGSLGWRAWNGSAFRKSSFAIQVYAAEGSEGKDFVGTYCDIEPTPVGGAARVKAVRIQHNGTLRFFAYGAGTLVTDQYGNVSVDSTLLNRIACLEARLAAAGIL